MMKEFIINGAKASIYLKYNGGIEELGDKISKGLLLPQFFYDTDQDFPHDIIGSCETLGFEITLKKMKLLKEFNFILDIQTEHSLKESFNKNMFDLSPWLARYISDLSNIEVAVRDANTNRGFYFKDGNISSIVLEVLEK